MVRSEHKGLDKTTSVQGQSRNRKKEKVSRILMRLECAITQNWRGKPLRTFETIVGLVGNTRTDAGL